jgi:hypothetical protein
MLKTRGSRPQTLLVLGLLATAIVSACGGEDFENEPRPAVTLQITGVITQQRVTVSPADFGAGPIVVTVSNQTQDSHRVTLAGASDEGARVREVTGPINPLDTATIQQDLAPGEYELGARSADDFEDQIEPAEITVGEPRPSASGELELP